MSFTKIFHSLAMASLVLVFACDGNKPATPADRPQELPPPVVVRDTTAADTLALQPQDGVVVAGTPDALQKPAPVAVVAPPVKKTAVKKPQARPLPKPPQAAAPVPQQEPEVPATAFQEGTYRLLSVQGDGLPLLMDMTTDCDTRLLHGLLTFKDGLFHFESLTEEACKNKSASQEKHTAEGGYRLEDGRLYLDIRYGDALGDASGVLEADGRLRLQQIGNGEERQEIDWVFARL